jgi:hypothetical protein
VQGFEPFVDLAGRPVPPWPTTPPQVLATLNSMQLPTLAASTMKMWPKMRKPGSCHLPAFSHLERGPAEATRIGPDGPRAVNKKNVLLSAMYKCHCAAKEKASIQPDHKKPRPSKKEANCPFRVEVVVYEDEPNYVYVFEHEGHKGHIPGDAEEQCYLLMDSDIEKDVQKVRSSCCRTHVFKYGYYPCCRSLSRSFSFACH